MERLACINVDLDGLGHYAAIHGLPDSVLGPGGADAVARLAPGRLCELLAGVGSGLPGTFFAIGEDLASREAPAASALRTVAASGHEIGNHTLRHRYDLVRLPEAAIVSEVRGGAEAVAAAVGVRPVGFRAPGYTLSRALLAAALETGHRYDSSTYPAVPYYLAKAAILGAQRVAGRRSRAILDRPRVLVAPAEPYRPSRSEPYARGDLPIWELPVTTAPWTRFPFIGTFVATLPGPAVDALYRQVRRRPFLNLELHGVDLMDASDGAGERLPRVQRDLAVPASRKIERLRALFSRIAADYEVVTLAEAAERLARSGGPPSVL